MSLLSERFRRFLGRLTRSWVLFAALGLVVGLALAPVAFQVGSTTTGTVAVIPIAGGINGQSAAGVSAKLQQARSDPAVEAVVLVSNSPGGGASASETLHLEVSRTAQEMPVVASVDAMAASGAYYAIAPTDYIYAKPSSLVGSVGVFVTKPTDPQPIDEVVASGPKKLSAGSERDWAYKVESLRRAFVGSVYAARSDNLTISRSELAHGNLFTGASAVQNGMADDIGGTREAVSHAARMAGLEDYNVQVMHPSNETVFVSRANYVASSVEDKRMVSARYFVGDLRTSPAVPNVVMMPPSVVATAVDNPPTASPTPTPNATAPTEEAP
jgi:protease-4